MVIAGGGIGGGAIDGVANLYVIDDATRAPIAGASVSVGSVAGVTDANGLFVAQGVTGKQDVVATMSGYRSEYWVGANGANLTMDLQKANPVIPQATLSGTITNWGSIQVATGHAKLALIAYSADELAPDAANNLKTPSDANLCIAATCNFSVLARAGKVTLVALIYDRDLKGTPNDASDDTQVLIGYAIRAGITVADGVAQTGQDLAIVDQPATETVDFGTPPTGLTAALGVIGVETNDGSGTLQLPVTLPGLTTALVPKLGTFNLSKYRLTALAQNTATPPVQSFVVRKHQTGSTLSAGTWQVPPSNIDVSRTHASWTHADGATVESVAYASGDTAVANVTVFDGSTSFDLPSAIALPTGTLTATVQALSAPGLDLTNFGIDADRDKIGSAASAPSQVP